MVHHSSLFALEPINTPIISKSR